jgi:hypothetical protein
LAAQFEDTSQPEIRERFHSDPDRCWNFINTL